MKLRAYADYESHRVALAESALFSIWPSLEPWYEDLVLVGGLVPRYICGDTSTRIAVAPEECEEPQRKNSRVAACANPEGGDRESQPARKVGMKMNNARVTHFQGLTHFPRLGRDT
jgi:hypothetical protein